LIEGGIRHWCWWRCSPKAGQNGPSTTATHIIIHQNSVSDSVVDEPQLKIPYRVHQPQTTKQASNGWGRDEPQLKKNCQFLFVYFEDCCRAKFVGLGLFTSANFSEYLP